MMSLAPFLWLPALILISCALYLGETERITITASIWQFPLLAVGMAALLVCAVSDRLPFRRVKIPGAAFIASVAYSSYLVQKLVIHAVVEFCNTRGLDIGSVPALISVLVCIWAGATILFFAVERPFLRLRHRIAARSLAS